MMRNAPEESLPGYELVAEGIADLSRNLVTDASLLVLIAAPRLQRLGIRIPDRPFPRPCEHQLYARLNERLGPAAHSYYNSLIRRITSFEHALEQARTGGRPRKGASKTPAAASNP